MLMWMTRVRKMTLRKGEKMAKDPAFLFYPGDWLGGTMTFSRSHKGAYMDLLMAQFNGGHLSLEDVETVLGPDFSTMWEQKLKPKFTVDAAGKFFNQKLEDEAFKRKNFTDSRKNNLDMDKHMKDHTGSGTDHHMGKHMENENINVNSNENKGKRGSGGKTSEPDPKPVPLKKSQIRFDISKFTHEWTKDPEFLTAFKMFNEMRTSSGHPMTVNAADLVMTELVKLSRGDIPLAIQILNKSTRSRYRDVFPLKITDQIAIPQNTSKINDAYATQAAKINKKP